MVNAAKTQGFLLELSKITTKCRWQAKPALGQLKVMRASFYLSIIISKYVVFLCLNDRMPR